MPVRPRICVVTSLFPTARERYRGAAIWSTLKELGRYSDLDIWCPLAKYPLGLRPRNFRYLPDPASTEHYGFSAHTLPFFAIPVVTRMWNGGTIYRALRRAVPADRPDLILSYYIYPEGYAAVRLAAKLGVPALVGSRGSDLRKIEANPFIRRMTRKTLRRASAVLCVSSDLAGIARRLGAATEKVHTLRNGIDTSVFYFREQAEARAELGIAARDRIVLFVGWLSALKGVPQLLEAVAMLNRGGTDPWRIALIGEGSLEQSLRAKAKSLGIQIQASFLGPLNNRRIAAWMNACDLLCLPSESEGCPNVIVEALSCGRPVVATQVGGIPELVNESSGVLVGSNAPRALADGLEKAGRTTWDRYAISRVNSRSWNQVAQETYQVCEQVLRNLHRIETLKPAYVAHR